MQTYLITGDKNYLKQYVTYTATIHQEIADLKNLVKDNPLQFNRVAKLNALFQKRIANYNFFIQMRNTHDLNYLINYLQRMPSLSLYNHNLGMNLRISAEEIYQTETDLLNHRNEILTNNIFTITKLGTIGEGISLIVILICILMLNRQIFIRIKEEEQLRGSQNTLRTLAYSDPLTGLSNRLKLLEELQKITPERDKGMIALFYLDLDNFKNINDSFGHDIGDILLQRIAERLAMIPYKDKFLARISGDEFAILFYGLPENNEISVIAQNVLDSIVLPIMINKQEIICTASIGISIYPNSADDGNALLKLADIAMYKAKELGKNNYQYGTREMSYETEERTLLFHKLYHAVTNKEFLVMYQPKMSLESGKISGIEALIRWNRPNIGLAYPAEFISLAESNGLINSIGEWMLRTVCNQANEWKEMGFHIPTIAVNVSIREFIMRDFSLVVKQILEETQFDPHKLEIEITETILMEKSFNNIKALHYLKELGIKITIDDFGTGFSSLSYLNLFPIDKLKIDKSFVAEVKPGKPNPVIISAIISMAHSLGIKVVAEGVETQAQLEFLKLHLCDEIQGYYYSQPLLPEDIQEFFAKHDMV